MLKQDMTRKTGKRHRIITAAWLMPALIFLTGCQMAGVKKDPVRTGTPGKTTAARWQNITPREAKERLSAEKGIILLDVRTQAEYDEIHIPGSMLIPLDVLKSEAPARLPVKDAVLFVYCRSGNRSATAAGILAGMGYTRVYNLGGIIDWPYETE
jgi:rhodanese-related sulfurtransferase